MTALKFLASFISLFLATLTLIVGFPAFAQSNSPQIRAASAQGLVKIQGQDTVVKVLVAIRPGENPQAAAQAALRRAYPDARPINSAEFRTTGLVWDVFSDTNPGNDFVSINYNPQDVPENLSDHRTVWLTSAATWTDVVTSNFVYHDGGDTTRCPSLVSECPGPQKFDGKNDIGWLNISDPSVLGVTWYGTSIDEFDMALDNQDFSWYTGDPGSIPGNAFDTQTVWLHEFGHGLGLGHSTTPGAVMEPYYEGVRRLLHQDDIDGIAFLYPASPSVTPTPTPSPTPTPVPISCAAPTIVSHSDTNPTRGGTVSFSWNPVPGATKYRIQRQKSDGSWSTRSTRSSTSYTGSDSSTDPNWQVFVYSGSCTPLPGPSTVFDP